MVNAFLQTTRTGVNLSGTLLVPLWLLLSSQYRFGGSPSLTSRSPARRASSRGITRRTSVEVLPSTDARPNARAGQPSLTLSSDALAAVGKRDEHVSNLFAASRPDPETKTTRRPL
jgi:hypothetical protein